MFDGERVRHWKDDVIERAGGTNCLVSSDFLEGGKTNPPPGSNGRSGHVGEANLDELEQRTAFEEEKKDGAFRVESFVPTPKVGGGKGAEGCAYESGGEACGFRRSSSEDR